MVVRRVDELDSAGLDQLVQPLDLVVGQLGLGDRALEGGAVQRAFLLGLGEERLERFVLCSRGGDGKAPSLVVVIDAPRARQTGRASRVRITLNDAPDGAIPAIRVDRARARP
jgi:hypothetical protein